MPLRHFMLSLLLALSLPAAHAELSVIDDAGLELRLPGPAKRIVSLAPHVTELLFAAGAGDKVVGVVQYSDFPEAARALPKVGGYSNLDLEAVAALKPDLVVGWRSGNRQPQLQQLTALGLPLYLNEPRNLDDVARAIERLGELAGTEASARQAAAAFRARRDDLARRYSGQTPVRTFYQIWDRPLMTINDAHLISDVIRLCGGRNVFGDLPKLAPTVSEEAVIAADPAAIVASGMGEARPDWLDNWKRWPALQAVRTGQLHFIPPELIQRHTPRILDGAERLCGFLAQTRALPAR